MVVLVVAFALGFGWRHAVTDCQRHVLDLERRLALLEQTQSAAATATQSAAMPAFNAEDRAAFLAHAQGRLDASGAGGRGALGSPSKNADIKRRQAQDRARFEARFRADGSDPRWAQDTETAATRAIAEPALGAFAPPTDSDMRCARTMCRMEFTFDSAGAAADWAVYYPIGIGSQLPVMRSQQTRLRDGRAQLVMYGFRDAQAGVR